MGFQPARTAVFALALASALTWSGLACGRRGAPLRPDAKHTALTLPISRVVRMGQLAAFQNDTTTPIQVDLVRVSDYTCGPAEPSPFFSSVAVTTTLPPWLTLTLPNEDPVYLRARDELGRVSSWFYLPPATASPPTPEVSVNQAAGMVTFIVSPATLPFSLEEHFQGQWLDYGLFQTSVTRGPFLVGERLKFRLFFVSQQQNGWAYSRQPAIVTPLIK